MSQAQTKPPKVLHIQWIPLDGRTNSDDVGAFLKAHNIGEITTEWVELRYSDDMWIPTLREYMQGIRPKEAEVTAHELHIDLLTGEEVSLYLYDCILADGTIKRHEIVDYAEVTPKDLEDAFIGFDKVGPPDSLVYRKANAGDYVVRSQNGIAIYTPEAFEANFIPIQ